MKRAITFITVLTITISFYFSGCKKEDEYFEESKNNLCKEWKPFIYAIDTDSGNYSIEPCKIVFVPDYGEKVIQEDWFKTERWTFRSNGTCVIKEINSVDSGTWKMTNDGDYNTVILSLTKNTRELKYVSPGDSSLSFEETTTGKKYYKTLISVNKVYQPCPVD